jgi:hypothetical protein
MFLAKEGRTYIVVKFVSRYGITAHRHLAGKGFAPEVKYQGPIEQSPGAPSYGGYEMVVMDWIDGTSAEEMEQLPADFVPQVREALHSLHEIN